MILRGDLHLIGQQIFHRMVRTVVAEFQFEGSAAKSKSAQLMSQTYAEDGDSPRELADISNGVCNRFGVAGTIRKKDAVWPEGEDVFRGSCRGDDRDIALVIDEHAKDVLLNAVVVSHDLELAGIGAGASFAHLLVPRRSGQFDRALLPVVGLTATDTSG